MQHHHSACAAGRNTPTNDEAHGSPQSAGPNTYQTQQSHPTSKNVPQQAQDSEVSVFNRLSRQFARLELGLYPLDGQSLLVSSHRLGMSRTLPDLRSAQIYLRQIGGVQ